MLESTTKTFKAILVIVTALCLIGCHHDNPLTIGSSRGIDERLIGAWRYRDKNERGIYTFMRRGGGEYFGQIAIIGEKPLYFRAYFSTVEGVDILNMQEVGSTIAIGKGKYAFFTYQFTPQGKLILSSIQLDSKQDAPSFALRREIGNRLAEGTLKVSSQTLTRVK